jgi:hypothetical protein
MARIRSLTPATGDSRQHPTEVDCTYQVIHGKRELLLQLSTYGSDDRRSQPKVSQTLQIDRKQAAELVRILRDAFPGLE